NGAAERSQIDDVITQQAAILEPFKDQVSPPIAPRHEPPSPNRVVEASSFAAEAMSITDLLLRNTGKVPAASLAGLHATDAVAGGRRRFLVQSRRASPTRGPFRKRHVRLPRPLPPHGPHARHRRLGAVARGRAAPLPGRRGTGGLL